MQYELQWEKTWHVSPPRPSISNTKLADKLDNMQPLDSSEMSSLGEGSPCQSCDDFEITEMATPTMEGFDHKSTKRNVMITHEDLSTEIAEGQDDKTCGDFDDVWSAFVSEVNESLPEENPKEVVEDFEGEEADIFEEILIDSVCKESVPDILETLKKTSETTDDEPTIKQKTNSDDKPLYPGSPLKVGAVMLFFCMLMMKHNLTETTMHDLFSTVSFVLPVGNLLCSNYSEFKSCFSALKYSIRTHFY